MKKLLLLVMILVWQNNFAQLVSVTTRKKEFIPAEIKLTSGETISGYIKEFNVPNGIEFPEFRISIESQLRMDRANFNFRRTLEGASEKIDTEKIKSITLKDEDTIRYEKIKLKTINSKLEAVDVNQEIMVPLIKEGKINVYGLKIYECSAGYPCSLMWILAYIKKPNDEFAYIPLDWNTMNLFNMGKIDDKFLKAFEEVGKDCPEFVNYIKENKARYEDKNLKKESKEAYKQWQKDKKEKLKPIKNKRERQKMEDELDSQYFLTIYLHLINEYSSRCN